MLLSIAFAINAFAFERIISLAPSVTRAIYQLDLQSKLIAVTMYCPDFAKGKENIGSILAPNIERIAALKPDLVIITKEGNNVSTLNKLRSIGLNVYVTGNVDSFNDICGDFINLGNFLGCPDKAHKIVGDARSKMAALAIKNKNNKSLKIFYQVGAQPIFTAGNKSFVNDIIAHAGAVNIFSDINSRFPQVSREEVIRRDPDAIVLVALGNAGIAEKKTWESFKALRAVKGGNVYLTGDTSFTDPSPQSIAEAANKLAAILSGVAHEK